MARWDYTEPQAASYIMDVYEAAAEAWQFLEEAGAHEDAQYFRTVIDKCIELRRKHPPDESKYNGPLHGVKKESRKMTVKELREVIREGLDDEKESLWNQIKETGVQLQNATGPNPFRPRDSQGRDKLNNLHRQLMIKYFNLVGKHWPSK